MRTCVVLEASISSQAAPLASPRIPACMQVHLVGAGTAKARVSERAACLYICYHSHGRVVGLPARWRSPTCTGAQCKLSGRCVAAGAPVRCGRQVPGRQAQTCQVVYARPAHVPPVWRHQRACAGLGPSGKQQSHPAQHWWLTVNHAVLQCRAPAWGQTKCLL